MPYEPQIKTMKTLNWKYLAVAISAGLFLFTMPAKAPPLPVHIGKELLTFDESYLENDLPVPNGYGGLSWGGFDVLDAVNYPEASGYTAGWISANNVIVSSESASIYADGYAFTLNSAYLTAGWNDNLLVKVEGYYLRKLVYTRTYKLSAVKPSSIKFPTQPVTEVDFTSIGGTHHAGYGGRGGWFLMDNLTVTILPTRVILPP